MQDTIKDNTDPMSQRTNAVNQRDTRKTTCFGTRGLMFSGWFLQRTGSLIEHLVFKWPLGTPHHGPGPPYQSLEPWWTNDARFVMINSGQRVTLLSLGAYSSPNVKQREVAGDKVQGEGVDGVGGKDFISAKARWLTGLKHEKG